MFLRYLDKEFLKTGLSDVQLRIMELCERIYFTKSHSFQVTAGAVEFPVPDNCGVGIIKGANANCNLYII